MLIAIDGRWIVVAVCAATFLLGSCSEPAPGDEYQRGNAFLDGGKFEKAAETWRPLADAGHLDAQLGLAALYTQGLGVPQDFSSARDLYEKAAGQGSERGQYYLGVIYAQGDGVEADQKEALRWFMLAARQGHVKSQLRVADAYYRGQGFERDFAEAYAWYSRAAAAGENAAVEKVALIVEQAADALAAEDITQTVRLAAMLHRQGDTATARRLLTKFAKLGNPDAQNELGYLITLLPGEKDYAQAASWFRRAASQNHPGAQNNLGTLCTWTRSG